MPAISYTVIATLPDRATAQAYVAWLKGGHLGRVLAGGARTARIVAIEDPAEPIQVETRYSFASRSAFEAYVRDAAPALRAEGLGLFGPETGVGFSRRVGVFA